MSNKNYVLTIDELSVQFHRVLKDTYPSIEISGKDIREFLIEDNSYIHFLAHQFAIKYKIDPQKLIEEIYLELMVEFEKNWHDRVFFKILKDNKRISFEPIKQDNK